MDTLDRFIKAQENNFQTALEEINQGKKQTHWMWYIFPQLQGLGYSEMAKKYAIKDLNEATKYMRNETLGPRLIKITKALRNHADRNAADIFGSPDVLKLRSCMTLFSLVPAASPVFKEILDLFFKGQQDLETLRLIKEFA
jgi:uncharacterized protein (DUF1810 family)